MQVKPFLLIVLDGWGDRVSMEHNAISAARTEFLDHLYSTFPHSRLQASEESVGLPVGQVGNSEVGHMTIGAGTIIDTDLVRITKAVREQKLGENDAFVKAFAHVKEHNSVLHLVGLVSPGGVHSHQEHLHELLRVAAAVGVEKIAIHAITDGRDTAPQSAANYIRELERVVGEVGVGFIATASGRFYAMDRDSNWERLARAESALFESVVPSHKLPASEVISNLHKEGILDEHLEPVVFVDDSGKSYPIAKNDSVIMFNFRADRSRMLAKKLAERSVQDNLCVVTMTEYEQGLGTLVAFPPKEVVTTLAEQLSLAGLSQAHVAETEKYAHATYFLNGGREQPHSLEEHVLVQSRKDVTTHDQAPEMRAREIVDAALQQMEQGTDFIFINFANADMVGHTANVPATIVAIETVDRELKRLLEKVLEKGGAAFITSDHGNAEVNVDPDTGERHTAHTNNLVPAILTMSEFSMADGTLADVAPTILDLLGLPIPPSMTGKVLATKKAQ